MVVPGHSCASPSRDRWARSSPAGGRVSAPSTSSFAHGSTGPFHRRWPGQEGGRGLDGDDPSHAAHRSTVGRTLAASPVAGAAPDGRRPPVWELWQARPVSGGRRERSQLWCSCCWRRGGLQQRTTRRRPTRRRPRRSSRRPSAAPVTTSTRTTACCRGPTTGSRWPTARPRPACACSSPPTGRRSTSTACPSTWPTRTGPTASRRCRRSSPGRPRSTSRPAGWRRRTDIGSSLDDDAPIRLTDLTTGERWPYWAELDAQAPEGEQP